MAYSDFKRKIPPKFIAKKSPLIRDFRTLVGREAARFRSIKMPTTNKARDRHQRWQDWLQPIAFDTDDVHVRQIDDDIINDMARGERAVEYAIIVYYRFHAVLDDLTFSNTIDKFVYGNTLRSEGIEVFRDPSEMSGNAITPQDALDTLREPYVLPNGFRSDRTESAILRMAADDIYDEIIEVEFLHIDCSKALERRLDLDIFMDASSTVSDLLNTIWYKLHRYKNIPAFSYGRIWDLIYDGKPLISNISFSMDDTRLLCDIGITRGMYMEVRMIVTAPKAIL